MDQDNCTNKEHKESCTLDIGRGCNFCKCDGEVTATACSGCFKLNSKDWLEDMPEMFPTDIFEVRFKNTRKSYFQNANNIPLKEGDIVAVEASPGHDIGVVSLTGDLVARQMKRMGFKPLNGEFKNIYRKAKSYDIEKWQEAISLEHQTMIRSRQIAADMGLNMKIGDVEYQGDKIKAIFYYIADERVDFRELIKIFAEQFRVRIEMKQIGARQEAGRIGGLGSCGRELCCASWISSFVSVTTNSARHQEISLNPQKLAGQCGKLKCCLVHELDTYLDARKDFPRINQPLQAIDGEYHLVKTDILSRTMWFSTDQHSMVNMHPLSVDRVKEIIRINQKGRKVDQLEVKSVEVKVEEPTYANVVGEDSLTRFDKQNNNGRKKGRGGESRDRKEGDENRGRDNRRTNSTSKADGDVQNSTLGTAPQRLDRNNSSDRKRPDNSGRGENRDRKEGGENRNRNRGNDRRDGVMRESTEARNVSRGESINRNESTNTNRNEGAARLDNAKQEESPNSSEAGRRPNRRDGNRRPNGRNNGRSGGSNVERNGAENKGRDSNESGKVANQADSSSTDNQERSDNRDRAIKPKE